MGGKKVLPSVYLFGQRPVRITATTVAYMVEQATERSQQVVGGILWW